MFSLEDDCVNCFTPHIKVGFTIQTTFLQPNYYSFNTSSKGGSKTDVNNFTTDLP